MKKIKRLFQLRKRAAVLAGAFLFFLATALSGQVQNLSAALEKAGYDPFVNTMAYTPVHSVSKKIAAEFLTYPLELVRWPVKKILFFVEDHRLVSKTRFIYEKLEDHGLTPKLFFTEWGAELDLPKALRLEEHLPESFVSKAWVHLGPDRIFETGSKIGFQPWDDIGFHAFGNVKYDNRPDEDFYGVGPHSSEHDESSYQMETTTLEAVTGYTHESSIGIDARAAYRNINISDSNDDDDGDVRTDFANQNLPGTLGDDLVTVGTEVSWKPGQSENPLMSPSKISFAADFNDGVHHSDARYFKFISEVSKSFELGSPRRVFAFHFYGEHNNRLPGHNIPFHQMARLGGFGTYPRLSHTMRAFGENRFYGESAALFNFEYRNRIYEYREWTLSHVLFLDEGQTFNRFEQFQFEDFRESYGMGFRLALLERVVMDFEMAHGDEGTAFYFKNRRPF